MYNILLFLIFMEVIPQMRQLAVLVSYSKMKLLPLDRIMNLCKKALRMSIHTHTHKDLIVQLFLF